MRSRGWPRRARGGFTLLEVIVVLLIGAIAAMMGATVLSSGYMKVEQLIEDNDAFLRVSSCMEEVKAAFDGRPFGSGGIDDAVQGGRLVCANGLRPTVSAVKLSATNAAVGRYELTPIKQRQGTLRLVTVKDNGVELHYVLGSE